MRNWLIKKLGGYTENEQLNNWLEERLHNQLSKKKSNTVDIYDDYTGTYIVKVRFIKQ